MTPIRGLLAFLLLLTYGLLAHAEDELNFPGLAFVKNPTPSYYQRPVYPRDARRNDISGSVRIALAISSEGQITERKVMSSEPPGIFDKAALDAVDKWRYQPHIMNGKPIAFQTLVVFRFETNAPPAQPVKFIWRTDRIQAEIRSGSLSPAIKISRYLHLTQDLNEPGWTMMNIVVPDQWRVRDVSVGNGYVRLITEDGDTYELTQNNVERMQSSIAQSYPVSNERLLEIWRQLALVVRDHSMSPNSAVQGTLRDETAPHP